MGTPAHWKQNRESPKCSKCGCESFTDIGECVTCGEILVFFGGDKMPKEKPKPTRRRIIAAEKWAKTRIPKNHIFRCVICGCSPPKIEDIYKDGAISIMVALLLKEKPEWEKANEIIERVYGNCEAREKEIQLVTKALVRETNMVLPVEKIEDLRAEAEKFLGEGEYSVCLQCLAAKNETHEPNEEEQQASLAAAMQNQKSEEDDDMGPKFKPALNHDPKWGEDTIDHEVFEDDPDENELEEDPYWDDDEWEDDWEETNHVEQAPVAHREAAPAVQAPPAPAPASAPTDGFWGDDDDDDWAEDIARARG